MENNREKDKDNRNMFERVGIFCKKSRGMSWRFSIIKV